jgi:hypothetical protein
MAEYIDRAVCLSILRAKANMAVLMGAAPYFEKAAQMLEKLPAADVAEVVRCKDCKHYDLGVCLKIYSDGNAHPEAWQSRKPDDFCSYGERKEVADNN